MVGRSREEKTCHDIEKIFKSYRTGSQAGKIKEYYKNVFAKDLLFRHIFFYYSNTNINKTIETKYKKQLPGTVYKSYYVK